MMQGCRLLALLLVAGCTIGVEPPREAYTSRYPRLVLAVEELQFENRATLPSAGNFIDRRRSAELAERTLTFLRARLQAGGGQGAARIVVERAQLIEQTKAKTEGLRGALVREADRVFDGAVAVRIAIEDWSGIERGFARAEVARLRPILENTDVASRDAEARRLIEDLMAQLDATLQKSVEDNLAAFLSF